MKKVLCILCLLSVFAFSSLGWETQYDMEKAYNTGGFAPANATAVTNTTADGLTATVTTSGTPAAGIGTCVSLNTQTLAAGNEEVGARLCSVSTDVTSTSEDFDYVLYLMAAGATATEAFRMTSTGVATYINGETWDNTVNGTMETNGSIQVPNFTMQDATEASGLLTLRTISASSGALTGATDTIEVDIPTGAVIFATQLRVDVAVTNAGDNTWAAAFSGGATQEIAAAATAAAKNTKIDVMFDANAATAIAASETDITLTPQAADFTAGEITAVVYYWFLTALDSAP